MSKVPLNQIYKMKRTMREYPEIKKTFDDLTNASIDAGFYRHDSHGVRVIKGRRYDDAVLFNSDIDFSDKVICEVGARDGIFGAWLSQYAKKVYLSDYFEEWGKGTSDDLGQIQEWTDIWKRVAPNPERLDISTQDMTNLTYPDNFFDIVISTSVIEHLYPQCNYEGDMVAMKEMVRVCKPGGLILLTTDVSSKESHYIGGTHYYSEEDLFKRLIDHSGCELRGEYDFRFDSDDNDAITMHGDFGPVAPVIFTLKKPES